MFCQGFLWMKHGRQAALEHVCAHGIKRRPFTFQAIAIIVTRRARKPSHYYGPPPSFITAIMYCQVLLRSPRFTIPTVTAIVIPSPHIVSRPSCFVHGDLKRDCSGHSEHSVNVA